MYRNEVGEDGSTTRKLSFADGGLVLARRHRSDDTIQYRVEIPGPGLNLILAHIPPGGRVERHAHQEREVFLFTGPAVWAQDKEVRTVGAFGAALTAPKQPHSYCPLRTEQPAWMLVFKFDPAAIKAYALSRLAFAL